MSKAILLLEDGTYFVGKSFGAEGEVGGELIFNTSLTGYQEILTDPSYKGQIVVMTYTQIGNYGVNEEDFESKRVWVSGFVVKEYFDFYSNWRAKKSLGEFLREHSVVGISGVDTRALVRKIRERGVMRGIISTLDLNPKSLYEKVKRIPDISEQDLVERVSTKEGYWFSREGETLVLIIDFGVKTNILRKFKELNCKVFVSPYNRGLEYYKKLKPDLVFLSNGPGDPARVYEGIKLVRELKGKVPIGGICLGHQIIGISLGGKTYKLKFGHHGGNHPVKDLRTGKIHITAQNHNFALKSDSLPKGVEVSHINLLDNTVEGIISEKFRIFSVQFHPENSPGPHDCYYIFKDFLKLCG